MTCINIFIFVTGKSTNQYSPLKENISILYIKVQRNKLLLLNLGVLINVMIKKKHLTIRQSEKCVDKPKRRQSALKTNFQTHTVLPAGTLSAF